MEHNSGYNFFDFVKQNSFERVKLNLNFKNGESNLLVKIGTNVNKNQLVAGGKDTPNVFAPFAGKIIDIRKVQIAKNNVVSSTVILERDDEVTGKFEKLKKEINTKQDFLIEAESKGVVDTESNSDLFGEIYPKIDKIDSLIVNFYDIDEYTYTYKYLFEQKINDMVNIINVMNNLFAFKKISIILDEKQTDRISRYKELFSKNKTEVEFIPVQKKFDYLFKLKFKLKTLHLTTKSMVNKNTLFIDAKTLFDLHRAINLNMEITSTYMTINGDAIKNTGVYLMPVGISVSDIVDIAEVKNSYEYIDGYVMNAMEAQNDKLEFEKEIENAETEEKKAELIKAMEQKEREAHENIFSKLGDTLEYYDNCLGLIYEVVGGTGSGIYSQENVISPSTNAMIMLTRKTLKKIKHRIF